MTGAEDANAALRQRLDGLLRAHPPLDVVITHIEVNDRHGVGALTATIFGQGAAVLSIRSQDHFGGQQTFGRIALRLSHAGTRPDVYAGVLSAVRGLPLRRVLCIPYYPDDVRTAIALKDTFALPLCTYLMDDQNVCADGIPDDLMRELLAKSDLRLAISGEIREAYRSKFGVTFAVVPPLVNGRLVLATPQLPSPAALAQRRGIVVGNIWGRRWLELLRHTVRGSGVDLDWYCNSGLRWTGATEEELAADGIHPGGVASDEALVGVLRVSPFAIIPSGTLDASDDRRSIAQLSLPSRIPYILATSHTPIVVLGDERTAAARFVTRAGIGLAVPYERGRFLQALAEISEPVAQERMRRRAAAMAPGFTADGALDWIWRSLEARGPVDDRYERLLPAGA